ncbi:MAG: hypothetical protein ACE5JP_12125 [Candidatus Bipolaricaulia bacterium]
MHRRLSFVLVVVVAVALISLLASNAYAVRAGVGLATFGSLVPGESVFLGRLSVGEGFGLDIDAWVNVPADSGIFHVFWPFFRLGIPFRDFGLYVGGAPVAFIFDPALSEFFPEPGILSLKAGGTILLGGVGLFFESAIIFWGDGTSDQIYFLGVTLGR